MESLLENVKKLYEEKRYKEILELGVTMKPHNMGPQILLVYLKTLLFGVEAPVKDDKNEDDEDDIALSDFYLNTLTITYANATTLEEFERIHYDITLAYREWKIEFVKSLLDTIKEEPIAEMVLSFLEYFTKVVSVEGIMEIIYHTSESIEQLCTQENISQEEYYNNYRIALPDDTSNAEIMRLKFDTATEIFQNGKEYLSNNNRVTSYSVKNVVETILDHYHTATSFFETCISDCNNIESCKGEKTFLCECYKKIVEVLLAELNGVVYLNGQARSICLLRRAEKIAEMKNFVAKIQEIDPNYTPSSYPREAAFIPDPEPAPVSAQSSSGGCYVATCVYGSYDCPEVWTLRCFRDNTLAESWYGRAFIRTYYATSPTLVKWFGNPNWFKKMWRAPLDRMVKKLENNGVENTPYHDKTW